jgi:hypothetical protein
MGPPTLLDRAHVAIFRRELTLQEPGAETTSKLYDKSVRNHCNLAEISTDPSLLVERLDNEDEGTRTDLANDLCSGYEQDQLPIKIHQRTCSSTMLSVGLLIRPMFKPSFLQRSTASHERYSISPKETM